MRVILLIILLLAIPLATAGPTYVCGNNWCEAQETCPQDNCCYGITKDLQTDEQNCGNCNVVCANGMECQEGVCVGVCGNDICSAGETCDDDKCCNGVKKDFLIDEANCGSCDNQVSSGQQCINALSVPAVCGDGECVAGENCPSDACCNGQPNLDLTTDNNFCGSCTNACTDDQLCENSECKFAGCLVDMPGLVSVWEAENNGNDRKETNNANQVTATYTTGKRGNAFNFNGYNYASIPHSDSLNVQDELSISVWVKPSYIYQYGRIIVKPHTYNGAPYHMYGMMFDPSARPYFTVTINNQVKTAKDSQAIAYNQWTHLVGTYDGSSIKLYKNGQEVASGAATGQIQTNTQPVYIGYNPLWYNDRYSGQIDEVEVYNKALTAEQIRRIYFTGDKDRCACIVDGNVEEWEECDDNDTTNTDECTNSCTIPRCGDNVCTENEDCLEDNCCTGDYVADFQSNANHCGACGNACPEGHSCIAGQCKIEYSNQDYAYFNAAPSGNTFTIVSSTTAGFSAGDAVLIVQMAGADNGKYEFTRIDQVIDATHMSVIGTLDHAYSNGRIVKVKEFTDLSMTSGQSIAAGSGGIAAVIVHNTLTLGAGSSISANGLGYSGGSGYNPNYCLGWTGRGGGGPGGGGPGTYPAQPRASCCDKSPYSGCLMGIYGYGGGGGYGTRGAAGGGNRPGRGGSVYGADTTNYGEGLMFGSGGGARLNTGGRGGGAVIVRARNLVFNGGKISAKGNAAGGDAGGGSGGTVIVQIENNACDAASVEIQGGSNGGLGRTNCVGWTDLDDVDTFECGDNLCEEGENCPADVASCPQKPNAVVACTNGCQYTCNSGFANCNDDMSDGCEVDLTTTTNCGSCANICPANHACESGSCVDLCGNDDCDLGETCEQDSCCAGNRCTATQECYQGSCREICGNEECDSAETCEADSCCNGLQCTATQECVAGSCQEKCGNGNCDPGETCNEDRCCAGVTVDFNTNSNHCGTCDNVCGQDKVCSDATCVTGNLLPRRCKQIDQSTYYRFHGLSSIIGKLGGTYFACPPNPDDLGPCPIEGGCIYHTVCFPYGFRGDVDNDGVVEVCTQPE